MRSLLFALVLASGGTPYTDTQNRFSFELPPGWRFAPMPGDTLGATFQKQQDRLLAHAAVRLLADAGSDLPTAVANISAASSGEPGYKLIEAGPVRTAGVGGHRRRYVVYVNGDPDLPKMVEQHILLVPGGTLVLYMETLAEAFDVFDADFRQMIATFRLGSGRPERPALAKRGPGAATALIGRWQGGKFGAEFTPGGTVVWGGVPGTYRLSDGVLVLRLKSGRQQFQATVTADSLSLSGPGWPEGQMLRKLP